jgi:exonuclease III
VEFANLNVCSATSVTSNLDKPTLLKDFITDQNIEVLALSETWLTPHTLPSTLNSITPENFSIIHNPRLVGRGDGVAFIYRSYLNISNVSIPSFTSFESLCVKLSIRSSSITFLTVYRPPSSSIPTFLSEFSTLLDDLNCSPSELVISGDFNIHVDSISDHTAQTFQYTLDTYHLTQHVKFPTHNHGHTLDLLITRSTSSMASTPDW